jgi:glycosyltransferase involved in cell wall biosynthesis
MLFLGTYIEAIPLIICFTAALAFVVQIYYYFFIFGKIAFGAKKRIKSRLNAPVPVSIVIAAKNEMERLEKNLPAFLNQKYDADFEVIVVDDCSYDETNTLLSRMSLQYPNLKSTFVQKEDRFYTGNKLALTVGLKAASYDWVIFSEPECVPSGPDWLSTLQKYFNSEEPILIGYSSYLREKNAYNRKIRYELFFNGLHYLGQAIRRKPYMAVHRNMAFRKQFFFGGNGFSTRTHLFFGEDDLFIQDNANNKNTMVCLESEGKTLAETPPDKRLWKQYVKKYATARRYYKSKDKLFLLSEPLSRLILYSAAVYSVIAFKFWWIILPLILLRLILQAIVFRRASRQLGEEGIVITGMLFDFLFIFRHLGESLANYLPRTR